MSVRVGWLRSLLVLGVLVLVALSPVVSSAMAVADDESQHVAVDTNGDLTDAAQAVLTKMSPARWAGAPGFVQAGLSDVMLGTLLQPAGRVLDFHPGTIEISQLCSAQFSSLGGCWKYHRDLRPVYVPMNGEPSVRWLAHWDGTAPGCGGTCHFQYASGDFMHVGMPALLDQYSSSQQTCNANQPQFSASFIEYTSTEGSTAFCWPDYVYNVKSKVWAMPDSYGLTITPQSYDPSIGYANLPVPYNANWVHAAGLKLADNEPVRDWVCHQINPSACAYPTGPEAPIGPSAPGMYGGTGGPGAGASPNVPRCHVADPVDCATGNLTETITDVAVSGKGLDLDVTRTYNAQDAATSSSQGLFGWGWSASWTDRIAVDPETKQTSVVASDGSRTVFYPRGSALDAPPWVQSRLTKLGDGSYRYVMPNQEVWLFSSAGRLTSKADSNGNTTTVAYDSLSRPLTITDPSGRTLSFVYDNGRVGRIDAPGGRSVIYGYDTAGNLTSVTDIGGGISAFGYDAKHRMTSMTDARSATTENVYDSADRVTLQIDPLDREMTFAYQGTTTTVTDPRGTITERTFDDNLPTQVVTAKGTPEETTKLIEYDARGNPDKITDERGNDWIYTYDQATGDRLTAKDPLLRQTVWTYDTKHNPLTEQSPSGKVTTYTYDSASNLKTISRPHTESSQTQLTTYNYDTAGQLTSKVDPLNHTWQYGYDSNGNLTSQTSPLGNKTTFAYNTSGYVTSKVTPKGNVTGGTPSQYTTTYVRNAFGSATQITDPRGKITTNVFDANQNQTSTTDRDNRQTQTTFDLLNRPTLVTRPDNSTLGTTYDENGNLKTQTDGNGKVTTYVYDRHERPISMTDPLTRTTSYGYDLAGNRTTVTDPSARTTSSTYNVANEVTQIQSSTGSPGPVTFTYTADGLRQTMVDETGNSSWTYDSLNRLKTAVNAQNQTLTYNYDLADRATSLVYPPALVPGAPGSTPSTVATGTVTRTFDDDDRMKTVKDWLNNTTTYTYDANSNISTIARPNGTTATNLYDVNDGLTKITDTGTGFSRIDTYTRTDEGYLNTQVETGTAAQPNPTYSYDPNHRLTGTGATAGQTYEYDPGDNPKKIVRGSITANQAFNDAHQLLTLKNAANATTATFAYNNQGERTSHTDTATGFVTTYAYDQAGRLKTFTGKDTAGAALTQTYGYDGSGTRRWTQASNVRTYHTWDPSGDLPMMIEDGSTAYIYGPQGVPIEQILSGGTVRYMHQDQLGSIRVLTAQNRSIIASYSYDPYGKPITTSGSGANANPFRYAGQYTDKTGLQYLRARYYDPTTAQFITRDPIEAETRDPYGYAGNSPVNASDPSGLFWGQDALESIADGASGFYDELTFGLTRKIRQGLGSDGVNYCSSAYDGGGLAALAAPGPGKLRLASKLVSTADKGRDLRRLAGRNRVSIETPNGRLSVDLRGDSHFEKTLGRAVDTPHVKFERRHVGPGGRVSYTSGPVRDATHADLRIVARALSERGR